MHCCPCPQHPRGPSSWPGEPLGPRAERRNSPHLPPGQQESAGPSRSKAHFPLPMGPPHLPCHLLFNVTLRASADPRRWAGHMPDPPPHPRTQDAAGQRAAGVEMGDGQWSTPTKGAQAMPKWRLQAPSPHPTVLLDFPYTSSKTKALRTGDSSLEHRALLSTGCRAATERHAGLPLLASTPDLCTGRVSSIQASRLCQ